MRPALGTSLVAALVMTLAAALVMTLAAGCGDHGEARLDSGRQLSLTAAVGEAAVSAGSMPETRQRGWSFDREQPAWRALSSDHTPWLSVVAVERVSDAVRVAISKPDQQRTMLLIGGLYVELDEGLELDDWEAVRVRARTRDRFAGITVAHNLSDQGAVPDSRVFFFSADRAPPVFNDGSVQTYLIPLEPREGEAAGTPLASLAVVASVVEPAAIDILAVELVPRGDRYRQDFGVQHVLRDGESRAALFAHTPASFRYRLEVPAGGRLDFGVTAEPEETVRYRITAASTSTATSTAKSSAATTAGEPRVLFDETVSEAGAWQQRSVDLSSLAGQTVELELAATSERDGSVGLWGAPYLSTPQLSTAQLSTASSTPGPSTPGPSTPGPSTPGPSTPGPSTGGSGSRPNVIFYIIDGGGSDLMSVYGYDRPTTPFLERLAAEAAVFERAYSNSTWTQPSTVSFMTSLHHSVLGGLRRGVHSTPVPAAATTMAEHFGRAGYHTASFTSNPNAGRLIGLERGVDVMLDTEVENHSTSSVDLHAAFWQLRDDYPGGPWWVHFQTTDVHEPNHPVPPFAGRLVSAEQDRQLRDWDQQLFQVAGLEFGRTSIEDFYRTALARAGLDRHAYFDTRRGLYDETMMHQDFRLAELVEELKESGRWQDTLLVIAADHGHPAGSYARFGRGLIEPQPAPWEGALFDSYSTRVPLLFIWPGQIEGGRRFEQPVSMIDLLPTLLDLTGLPQPEVYQGQSLAPLLTGGEQELRPVILDEFRIDDATGEMIGNLEIVDGRWGASLEIGPRPAAEGTDGRDPARRDRGLGRHAVPIGGRWGALHPYYPEVPRLLLYDLQTDPFATRAVNEDHPELVDKYLLLLRDRWEGHKELSQRYREADGGELTPEQLQRLKALGYIN